MGDAAGGVGAALALLAIAAGTGGGGQQRVIAPLAGIAVVAYALLGQSAGLADGGVQADGQGRVAGSGPSSPGPCQQLAAHPAELTDVAPPEAAQEGAQSGRRLDHTAQHTPGAAGTQRISVVDAVAPSQGRRYQGHQFVAGVGPARGISQVNVAVRQFIQTQAQSEAGGQQQPGIGYQAVVVEGDADAVGGLK